MSIKKKIIFFIGLIIMCLCAGTVSKAASASITDNQTITTGSSVTINGSANAGAWNLTLSGNGESKSLVGYTQKEGNSSASTGITFTPSKAGTYTFTLSGDVTDYDTEKKSNINKTCTITVTDPEPDPEPTPTPTPDPEPTPEPKKQEKEKNTETNTKTEEPTFSNLNEVRYVDTEGQYDSINVRSSYSTSSDIIGTLKDGEEITVIATGSNGWSKITYGGQTAYVSSSLLSSTKPVKEKSANKALKSLTIAEGTLKPEFNSEVTQYEVTVGKDVKKLDIEAVAEDENSKVEISGNEDLQLGENTVKVIVTAEDETARTYIIKVNKKEDDGLQLSALTIKNVNLSPKFSPTVYSYTTNVDNDIEQLNIKAKASQEDATVEILGNEKLKEGENTITIMVKSKDGSKNVTYQITVKKLAAEKKVETATKQQLFGIDMQYIILGGIGAAIFIVLILIILVIRRIIKNRDEDEFDENDFGGINLNTDFMNDLNENNTTVNENEEDSTGSTVESSNEIFETYNEMNTNYNAENENSNRLYDIEKEVDFSEKVEYIDEEEPPKKSRGRRKGKHF